MPAPGEFKSTRDAARAAGDRFFFTGIACVHGHISERYVSCRRCVECHRTMLDRDAANAYKRQHYQDFKDVHAHNGKQWAAQNREKSRAIKRKWRERNHEKAKLIARESARDSYRRYPEKIKAKAAEYRKNNPEKVAASLHNWRASNADVVLKHSQTRLERGGRRLAAADIKEILARQKGRCASCGQKTKLHLDHILPLALGGDSDKRNFQGLCPPCNGSKHAKHPVDFNRSRGLLL